MTLRRRKTVLISIYLVFMGIFLGFYIYGCSARQGSKNWEGTWGIKDDSKLSNFFSSIRTAPGNPDSHFLLACYYQERGRHREAIEEFEKVLFINPDYVKAYDGLGMSYDQLADFPRAIEYYKKGMNLNPDLDYLQNNLGYSYLLQGNYEEAVSAFKKAITLNSQDSRFHNNLGLAYGEKGEYDLAMVEFELAGDEAKAHLNMAQLYFKRSLYNEARQHYAKALGLNPSSTTARTGMEATSALASIFQPPKKAKTEDLATPEPLTVKETPREEFKNPVQSASVKAIEGRMVEDDPKIVSDKLSSASLANPTVIPLPSQKAELGESRVFYEVQVASFRERKIAIPEANYLQESAFRAIIRSWKDKKGNEWYPLVVGPFMTREEALTVKSEIAGRNAFEPAMIKSKNVEAEGGKLFVHDQSGGIESVNLPEGAGIEITNGNGVDGMASRVGDFLRTKGLKVIRLTNANSFAHASTSIFYQKGYHEAAGQVAKQLPVAQNMEELKKSDRPNVKIRVLIGKDIIPHGKLFKDRQRS